MLGQFPRTRLRRNRRHAWLRDMLAETQISMGDIVWPVFIQDEPGKTPIDSLAGINRYGADELITKVKEAHSLGIPAVALFPFVDPSLKSDEGDEAWNPDNLVCRTVKTLKDAVPDMGIITDVALDPYTTGGHDGLIVDGDVHNDRTIDCLLRQSLTLAEAGADFVAPSDMMDGRIGAIRKHLDNEQYQDVGIISYAVKYASAYYGPFRDAVGSSTNLGGKGKHSYQMDFRNSDEAMREVALDIDEGADIVMVKPALSYLDIIQRVKDNFNVPVMAYHVSGEYAMLKAAEAQGWLDGPSCLFESLTACKRAGAASIWTYGALELARFMEDVV